MKERLAEERKGLTHHFVVVARCDRKKCRNVEDPDKNCTQCAGSGIYEVKGYVTANTYEDGRLGEVFVRAGKAGSSEALLDQWAIAASCALQYGAPVEGFFRKFVGTRFEPSGATRNKDIPRCTSILDYVSRWVLSKYVKAETESPVASAVAVAPVTK